MVPYWGARLRTVASNGCRDVHTRVKRRSITERTPIAASRATVPLRHSRRGLWCERGGTVPDPFSPVAEHPGPRKGLGKRLRSTMTRARWKRGPLSAFPKKGR